MNNINYFLSADDVSLPYYKFEPDNEIKSAIILVYEIFGITPHIKNFAKILASKGYLVYVPDIFHRIEKNVNLEYNQEGFKEGLSLKEKIGWDYPVMDIVALGSLLKQKYKVTCYGFCFGGSVAWRASQKSFLFDNAICYYGSSIPDFLDKKINNPVMVHFGKLDSGIPEDKILNVKSFSKDQNFKVEIYEYDGADHGFNCEDRKSYNAEASKSALERSIAFIDNHND